MVLICINFAFHSIYFLHVFLTFLPAMLNSSLPHSFKLPHVNSFISFLTKFSFNYAHSLHILYHLHQLTDETINKNQLLQLCMFVHQKFDFIEQCYYNKQVLIRGRFLQKQASITVKILKKTCNALKIVVLGLLSNCVYCIKNNL